MDEQPKSLSPNTRWEDMTPMERILNVPDRIRQNFQGTKAQEIAQSVSSAFTYNKETGLTYVPKSDRPQPKAEQPASTPASLAIQGPNPQYNLPGGSPNALTPFTSASTQPNQPIAQPSAPVAAPSSLTPLNNGSVRSANDLVGFNPQYEGQSLSDYMAGRDNPSDSTIQGNDFQGRLRRFDSPASLAQNLEQGQAQYDLASAERSDGITFRRDQPGSLSPTSSPNPSTRVPSDVRSIMLSGGPKTPQEAQRIAQWDSSTQGQASGGSFALSPQRQNIDYQNQLNQENALRRNALEMNNADYREQLTRDTMQIRQQQIQEAGDQEVLDQYNAILEADGEQPIADPSQARAGLFEVGRERITMQEEAFEYAIGNLDKIEQFTKDQYLNSRIQSDSSLSKALEEHRSEFPDESLEQSFRAISSEQGRAAESAAMALESLPAEVQAGLASNPDYAEMKKRAEQAFFDAREEARRNPFATTRIGVPSLTPYTPSASAYGLNQSELSSLVNQ